MTFERPWMLLLLAAPLLSIIANWRRPQRKFALLTICICALGLAASKPVILLQESRTAIAVLADTSASISDEDLRRESEFVRALAALQGKNVIQITPFARFAGPVEQGRFMESWRLTHTPGSLGHNTDLEQAVRSGLTRLPPNHVCRIIVLSDGRENVGSVMRAAARAKALGVPIDTIPMAGHRSTEFGVEMAAMPMVAFSGEPFPIDLVLHSPRSTEADVLLSSNGNLAGRVQTYLTQGVNRLRVRATVNALGNTGFSANVRARDVGELGFSTTILVHQSNGPLISSDNPALSRALLNIRESADAQRDVIQHILPKKVIPPKREDNSCFVLMFEKSSSMDGRKLQLAKLTALAVVENLRGNDKLGVLVFDDAFRWALPIRNIADRDAIDEVIESVNAGGGTRVGSALNEALQKVLAVDAACRHVVLIADGSAEDIEVLAPAHRAASEHVTISTVALGETHKSSYLARVARWTGGESVAVDSPWAIENTVLQLISKHRARANYSRDPLAIGLIRSQPASAFPRHSAASIFTEYEKVGDEIVINYAFNPGRHLPDTQPDMFAYGPDDYESFLNLEKVSKHVFQTRLACNHIYGLFWVKPPDGSMDFPQVGVYSPDPEMDGQGANFALLRQISLLTHGRFNPNTSEVLGPNGRTIRSKIELWPLSIVVVLVLWLFDRRRTCSMVYT